MDPTYAATVATLSSASFSSSTSSFDLFESEVNHLLSKNSDTYKVPSELQIFCGTWNVNGKVEEGGNLIAWLESGMTGEVGEPDIFAIGLQEVSERAKPAKYCERAAHHY